ncbi:hypothetical protein PGB90_006789 [Kerria lacca]
MGKKNFFSSFHPVENKISCTEHLLQNKHYIFPGLNVCSKKICDTNFIKCITKSYSIPLLNIHRPLPCLSSKFNKLTRNSNEDCVLKFVRNKHIWKQKKKRLLEVIKSDLHKRKKIYADIKNDSKNQKTLPYGVVKLAAHLATDPDKHFKGFYNWYYGNSIAIATNDDEPYLLHATGDNLNSLVISSFEIENETDFVPVLSPKISVLFPNVDPIYDVVVSKISGLVGVRQRNCCSFFQYENNDIETTIKNNVSVKNKNCPFICMDVNSAEFCTINANREIQFWNPLIKNHCIQNVNLPKSISFLPDNFVQVKYDVNTNCQTYIVVDRNEIYLFDKRQKCNKACSSWKTQPYVELCENISLLIPSIVENHWYIGLTHSCLLLDARIGFIQKWTHMLPQTPTVGVPLTIEKTDLRTKEALILSTQSTNDTVAIYNKWSSGKPVMSCTPVALPNRIDTLHDARINGVLSHPGLKNKFDFSVIGLSAYKYKTKMGIFSLTSTGDIFHQVTEQNKSRLFSNEESFTQSELSYLKTWESDFRRTNLKNSNNVSTTGIADMSELVDNINYINIEFNEWPSSQSNFKPKWKKSKKCLESYKDLLAPFLLQDFELDDISEWDSDEENEKNQSDINNYKKVENWLLESKNTFNDSNDSQSISEVFETKMSSESFKCSDTEQSDTSSDNSFSNSASFLSLEESDLSTDTRSGFTEITK